MNSDLLTLAAIGSVGVLHLIGVLIEPWLAKIVRRRA